MVSINIHNTDYSSWIQRINFSSETGASFMVADKLYLVEGLSYELFEAWKFSHSVGTFFNRHIKNVYPIKQLHY